SRRGGRGRQTAAAAAAATAPVVDTASAPAPEALPREPDAIVAYLTGSYRGVGQKTAEALVAAFGPDLFETLRNSPDRIRDLLGARRAATVLGQWQADADRRGAAAAEAAPKASPARRGRA